LNYQRIIVSSTKIYLKGIVFAIRRDLTVKQIINSGIRSGQVFNNNKKRYKLGKNITNKLGLIEKELDCNNSHHKTYQIFHILEGKKVLRRKGHLTLGNFKL